MPRSNQRQPSAFRISQSRRKRNSIATFGIVLDMAHQVDRRLLAHRPSTSAWRRRSISPSEPEQRRALGGDVAGLEGAEREGLLGPAARREPVRRDRRQPVEHRRHAAGGRGSRRRARRGRRGSARCAGRRAGRRRGRRRRDRPAPARRACRSAGPRRRRAPAAPGSPGRRRRAPPARRAVSTKRQISSGQSSTGPTGSKSAIQELPWPAVHHEAAAVVGEDQPLVAHAHQVRRRHRLGARRSRPRARDPRARRRPAGCRAGRSSDQTRDEAGEQARAEERAQARAAPRPEISKRSQLSAPNSAWPKTKRRMTSALISTTATAASQGGVSRGCEQRRAGGRTRAARRGARRRRAPAPPPRRSPPP